MWNDIFTSRLTGVTVLSVALLSSPAFAANERTTPIDPSARMQLIQRQFAGQASSLDSIRTRSVAVPETPLDPSARTRILIDEHVAARALYDEHRIFFRTNGLASP